MVSCAVSRRREPLKRDAGSQLRSVHLPYEIAAILDVRTPVDVAAKAVLRAVSESLGWDAATFWRMDRRKHRLRSVSSWDRVSLPDDEFRLFTDLITFAPGVGVPGQVWKAREPLSVLNFLDSGLPRAAVARTRPLRSVFAFPVAVGRDRIGVMEFFSAQRKPLARATAAAMAAIGAQVGQFIRHAELQETADEQQRLARQVLDSSLDAIVTIDAAGLIAGWNRRSEATFGWTASESLGRPLSHILSPAKHRSRLARALKRLAGGPPGAVVDERLRIPAMHRDGRELPVEITVTALGGTEQAPFTAFIRDLSAETAREERLIDALAEQRESEHALGDSLALLSALTEGTSDVVFVKDVDGSYQLVNAAGSRFLGLAPADVIGRRDLDLFSPAVAASHVARDAEVLRTGKAITSEHRAIADGRERVYQAIVSPYRDGEGRLVGTLGIVRDVTEQKALELELAHRALHDSLTSLPNRALFRDRLGHAVTRATRAESHVGVAFVDLDHFKIINDGLGHAAADQVLVAVAARLSAAVREADTVARFGGDEFAVLWEDPPADVAFTAHRLLEALKEPVLVDGREIFVRASIGVAVGARGRETADELIRRADAAMYRAKRQGRGRVEFFDHGSDIDPQSRLSVSNILARAIERDDFVLDYQPIIDLSSGKVVSVEALVRMQHPVRGVLHPDAFIPVAEETGEIERITAWVLREALRQCAGWHRDGMNVGVAVNLSVRNLEEETLPQMVRGLLSRWGTPPELLTLEVTESAVMTEPERTARVLSELRRLSVRLSIDDFGTGYSSLSYVKRLPVHEIKIDRSFVLGMGTDASNQAIVRSTVALAHELGLEALAEGVEDGPSLARLRELGCDRVQGHHIGRPMPLDALREWMARRPMGERKSAYAIGRG